MKKDEKESSSARIVRIKQEASEWISLQDRGFSPKEQDEFFNWLAKDPMHGEFYRSRLSVWKNLDVLTEWRPEHSLEPNPDLLALPNRSIGRTWISGILAIAALIAFGFLATYIRESVAPRQGVLLAVGDRAQSYEYHALDDGSIVELNRGAQVSVLYDESQRLINLLSGEAHFTVAKDPRRPFVVKARGTVVEAVGTMFNVMLSSEEIEVMVTEGRVVMNSGPMEAQSSDDASVGEPAVRELVAGQRSVVDLDASENALRIEQVTSEEIAKRLAWKSEFLDFTDASLSDVILEFNRRNHTQIVIADPEIGSLKITASLRPNNLDGFIELLQLTLNVDAQLENESKISLHLSN